MLEAGDMQQYSTKYNENVAVFVFCDLCHKVVRLASSAKRFYFNYFMVRREISILVEWERLCCPFKLIGVLQVLISHVAEHQYHCHPVTFGPFICL